METTTRSILLDELQETFEQIESKKSIVLQESIRFKKEKEEGLKEGTRSAGEFLEFWECEIELLKHKVETIKSMLIKDSIHL